MLMPVKTKKRYPFHHLFFLAVVVFGVWFWSGSLSLIPYSLHLVAFLVAFYSLTHLLAQKKTPEQLIWDMLLFVAILLLVLATTGGLGSPFFFLLYFLLFAAALLLGGIFTFELAFLLIFFFVRDLRTLRDILQLLSFLFLTPLALYFGKQYLRLAEAQKKIKILRREGWELEQMMAKTETDSLLWLSLNLKNGLLKIIHHSSELLSDLARLNLSQKEKLQQIHKTGKELLESGEKLMDKIDQESD
jgi:hypothetical protein